jgi:hypothetical protein
VIWAGVLSGSTLFLGVCLFVRWRLPPGGEPGSVLAVIVVPLLTVAIPVALRLPRVVRGTPRQEGSPAMRRLILSLVPFELAALAAMAAHLFTGSPLALVLALAALAAMALSFPGDRRWARLSAPAGRPPAP